MKSKFSTAWKASKQPRKQRKFLANAPLHLRHRFLSANLSKELRKRYGKRNIPIRKGDEVLVMRGKFAKKKGKITEVNVKQSRVVVENLNATKRDGTKVNAFFKTSNLQIHALNLEDKERVKKLGVKPQEKPQVMKGKNSENNKTEKKENASDKS